MIYSVQYLRAIAALAVALFHFRPLFVAAGGSEAVASTVDWGHAGVPVFFVIAGFIMVWSTQLQARPSHFIARRLVRIYGGYLPIALAFLAYKAATSGVEYWIPGSLDFWGSLLLIQTDPRRLLIYPAWTLPYELLFYGFFATCLITERRRFALAFTAGTAAIALTSMFGSLPAGLSAVIGNPINLNFVLGVIAGLFVHANCRVIAWPTGAMGIALIGYGMSHGADQNEWVRLLTYGGGLSLLLPMLTQSERSGVVPQWRWGVLLGDASYALYIIHAPVLFLLQTTSAASNIAWYAGPSTLAATYLTLIIGLSVGYHALVERPMQSWLRRLLGREPMSRPVKYL